MAGTLPSQGHPCSWAKASHRLRISLAPRKVTNRETFQRQKFTYLVPATYSTLFVLPHVTYICLLFPLIWVSVSSESFYPACGSIRCTELQTGDRGSLQRIYHKPSQVLEQGLQTFKKCWTVGIIISWEELFWSSGTTSCGLRTWTPVLNYAYVPYQNRSEGWIPGLEA